MARIFICGDSGQALLLDAATAALAARGYVIVRGPLDTPGERKVYTVAERAALINDADVAMFTTRHECSRDLLARAAAPASPRATWSRRCAASSLAAGARFRR